jgi:hypothetical protein
MVNDDIIYEEELNGKENFPKTMKYLKMPAYSGKFCQDS